MTSTKQELLRRANLYAQNHGLGLGELLGFGVHGIVFVVESQIKPGREVIKVHEREEPYCRERDVYLRFQQRGVSAICGCHVPQLLQYDDELWVIKMEIVTRPFVLDFAGAYLDQPPDFSDEVLADWRTEKQEQFGERWPDVVLILSELRRYGVFMVDINPGNIAFSQ